MRPLVVDVLLRADPRWEGLSRDDAPDLLEAYGVRRKPALLRCAMFRRAATLLDFALRRYHYKEVQV